MTCRYVAPWARALFIHWQANLCVDMSWKVLLHHARGEATRYLVTRGHLGLNTTSDLASRCSCLTSWNIYNSGGKFQKHENSHWWIVRKHPSPSGVVPDRTSSRGQMALRPICWQREATSRNGVKTPVDFPSSQLIESDASRRLASHHAWC